MGFTKMFYISYKRKLKKLKKHYQHHAGAINWCLSDRSVKIDKGLLEKVKENLIILLGINAAMQTLNEGGFFRYRRAIKEYYRTVEKLKFYDFTVEALTGQAKKAAVLKPIYIGDEGLLERLIFNEEAENFSVPDFFKSTK